MGLWITASDNTQLLLVSLLHSFILHTLLTRTVNACYLFTLG